MAYLVDPSGDFAAITPSDTVAVGGGRGATRAIYVGGGGDLAVKSLKDDTVVTFVGVPAGTTLSIRANFVMAATTATDIVGLW